MMDILNIDGRTTEEKIEKAIENTHEELSDLVEERMCMVYTDTLARYLSEEHTVYRKISTKELGQSYDHNFILVPKEENYYLIDLTFSQFRQKEGFQLLTQKGYQYIDNSLWNAYIEIVCMESPKKTMEEAFNQWEKRK